MTLKIAIIGTRTIFVENMEKYLEVGCEEIVSGGAKGVDARAADFARENGIKLTEFLPDYSTYGRAAPIVRNRKIVEYADKIIAFWDGKSRGTQFVIKYAEKLGKPCRVVYCDENKTKP